jgi:Ion channel
MLAGLRRHKHAVLLAVLLVALAVETFHAQSAVGLLRWDLLRTGLIVAIWIVVFERRRERIVMAAALLASLAIDWGQHVGGAAFDYPLSVADQVVMALFLWSAVYVILRDLFHTATGDAQNVLGAICGYLIAGNAWARMNAVAYLMVPSAYSINPELAGLLPDWHGRTALFTYYAFAQVMTIGYSDVTPIRAPATTLSLFASLFGVFYTAVVVSQFVGLAQRSRR